MAKQIQSTEKFDTDDIQISFQIFDVILQNFTVFWDFNRSSSRKENLQMLLLKSEEKIMENVCGSDQL